MSGQSLDFASDAERQDANLVDQLCHLLLEDLRA